ncbi:AP2/ERF and B3 domain-containing protein Os01g0141000-like [Phragmites australis]|uniref:AP2/ERF and B3 domain-containing protein Os01g0141000-like n=1 Tax=Phragmites australis TaxID=29695 RepID=UPI002D766833|nr:AP2/ERF and B3 domain-containing protein Os01g0141000-like [Phragmites australis]
MAADFCSSSRDSGASMESGAAQLTTAATPRTTVADVLLPPDEAVAWRLPAAAPGSSQYKGVAPRPNGRWGARIYKCPAQVWLGTFPDKEAAARAYDTAAPHYRGHDITTNLPSGAVASAQELAFLAAQSKAEIVDMLQKLTYDDELRQGLSRSRSIRVHTQPTPAWARVPLFEKTVTASDVGKLSRLHVPKQHAEKLFPLKRKPKMATAKAILLNFEDDEGTVWRFRYSYLNTSQSYVLNKDWIRFVREKGLRAGDTVLFSHSTYGPEKQLFIHCKKNQTAATDVLVPVEKLKETRVVRLFGVDIAEDGCPKSNQTK